MKAEVPESADLCEAPALDSLGVQMAEQRLRERMLGELAPPTRIDRFVLERQLGSGGMGTVWRAFDEQLDRPVAIKFLRNDRTGDRAEQRMFREAQGLAKLSHPHVVPVYDVGRHQGRVWVAMEYVPGRTLRAWVAQDEPSTETVLRAWVAAGRGIAAVHAAGLVHRDIKPDNVMLGDDGRVRLVDFGLVRAVRNDPQDAGTGDTQSDAPPSRTSSITASGSHVGGDRLTRTQQFLGTLAYAAPEQRWGGAADPRVDQYAFCVSVWEALTGERPTVDDVPQQAGEFMPLPDERTMPARIRKALSQGLSWDPRMRFADMDGLLAQLEPRRRAWVLPTITAVLAGSVGLGVAFTRDVAPPPCAGAEQAIAQVWDHDAKVALDDRFDPEVASRAQALLDDWAASWSSAARHSCEEVHVQQLRSVEALDRRGACLAVGQGQLETLLAAVEAGEITRAPVLAAWMSDLDDPERCLSPTVTEGRSDLPPAEYEAEIADIRRELQRARLGTETVSLDERIEAGRTQHERGLEIGWTPLIGQAALVLGELCALDGRTQDARAWLGQALDHGQAQGDPRLLADAHSGLAQLELLLELDEAAAQWRIDRQRALVDDLADALLPAARLAANEGRLHQLRGDLDGAEQAFVRAIELWERAGPRHAWSLATGLRLRATVVVDRGRADEATALVERAQRLERLGQESARVVERHVSTLDEGDLALVDGRLEDAESLFREALQAALARQGPRGLWVARSHVALSGLFDATGDRSQARRHAEAAEQILAATVGPSHPDRVDSLTALGTAEYREGRFAEAAKIYQRALTVAQLRLPAGSLYLGRYALNLGDALAELGRDAQAEARLREALEILESKLRPDHPHLAVALKSLGSVRLRRADHQGARESLRRALAIFEATGANRVEHAEVLWLLAQADAAAGDPGAAREHAESAADAFAALGDDWTTRVNEIREWGEALDREAR